MLLAKTEFEFLILDFLKLFETSKKYLFKVLKKIFKINHGLRYIDHVGYACHYNHH